jgi:hypothetical protein
MEVVLLQLIVVEDPLEQWGMDIIGEINPQSSKQQKYILIATNYFTCWTEVVPLTKVNDEVVMHFLEEHIITRFGVPNSLVFDKKNVFFIIEIG